MSKIDIHIEGSAYSKAAKRRAHAARRAQMAEAAAKIGLPALQHARLRQPNAQPYRAPETRDPMVDSLKARCRQLGIPTSKWRQMRDPWWGCEAGRAMAKVTPDQKDRALLWDAICHMRRVIVAYDRVIGAPSRHAQCLRLLLPLEELRADSATPPIDDRTDEQRQDDAVRNLQWLEEWLGRAGPMPTLEASRVVWDDVPARNVEALMRAMWAVSDGICGHVKRR